MRITYQSIIGIIIGIGFIIGGLSGEYVLAGTNSPELLIIAGVVILIADLYYMFFYNKN
ncbi:MAG: hypothetical protein LBU74_04830 [Methanobacteriaceae archaeon]|jgi:uncharacterized membrane protein YfcA|nr:hypothetical protein [Candidatus Methanorudis spinitermitis]